MGEPNALPFLLPRPELELGDKALRELRNLAKDIRSSSAITWVEYDRIEKWKLLCFLADSEDVVLHGTGDPTIEEFVPRKPVDSNPFGAQNAVYAASDGIWPMYYAILDRATHRFSLMNGCVSLLLDDGGFSDPYYFFSIEAEALKKRPYRDGFVYVLPKATFKQDPQTELGSMKFKVAHWASLESVRPWAIVPVSVADFPFLDQMRGHDDAVLAERMQEDPERFPWVDEQYATTAGLQ